MEQGLGGNAAGMQAIAPQEALLGQRDLGTQASGAHGSHKAGGPSPHHQQMATGFSRHGHRRSCQPGPARFGLFHHGDNSSSLKPR